MSVMTAKVVRKWLQKNRPSRSDDRDGRIKEEWMVPVLKLDPGHAGVTDKSQSTQDSHQILPASTGSASPRSRQSARLGAAWFMV